MFFTGGPGKPIELGDQIHSAIDDVSSPGEVRIGFAYATKSGISSLCVDDSGTDWRNKTASKWMIGLDQGITEPAALRELANHSDTDLRVLIPGGKLNRDALYRRPRFHAKVAMIESGSSGESHLVTTSANMTASALEDKPTNYEIGMTQSTSTGLTNSDIDAFDEWWESAWSRSQQVTDSLLGEYDRIRDDYFGDNPDIREFESSTSVNHASEAKHLWIETKKMTGGSGNQVEFNTELSPFIASEYGEITIIFNGTTYDNCSVTPRVTDPPFGQEITPVYLPTGFDYTHSTIHLERLSDDPSGRPQYELTVADQSNDIVDEWRQKADRDGVRGQTGGGRDYGYY